MITKSGHNSIRNIAEPTHRHSSHQYTQLENKDDAALADLEAPHNVLHGRRPHELAVPV